MNPSALIAIARALLNGVIANGAAEVSQTELRRAVSCAYYAMFHTLTASNADALIGDTPVNRQRWTWQQAYRAIDHRPTRNKLTRASLGGRFPVAVSRFGEAFAVAQRMRHAADYDPEIVFSSPDVAEIIDRAEVNINDFNQIDAAVRRDLAIHILTNIRSD